MLGADVEQCSSTRMERPITQAEVAASVAGKLKDFTRAREAEKARRFYRVIRLGNILFLGGHMLMAVAKLSSSPTIYKVAPNLCVNMGLCLYTTFPVDVLDFDDVFERHAIWRIVGGIFVGFFAPLGEVANFQNLWEFLTAWSVLVVGWCGVAAGRGWLPANVSQRWPRHPTWCVVVVVGGSIHDGFTMILSEKTDATEEWKRPLFLFNGYMHLVVGLLLLIPWYRIRRKTHCCTSAFYTILILEMCSRGTVNAVVGIQMTAHQPTAKHAHYLLLQVVSQILPPLLFFAVGRRAIYMHAARMFDRRTQRAHQDGAFISELQGNMRVVVGQTWWMHHGRDDERYPPFDPRRNWSKGIVESVSTTEFTVRITGKQELNARASHARGSEFGRILSLTRGRISTTGARRSDAATNPSLGSPYTGRGSERDYRAASKPSSPAEVIELSPDMLRQSCSLPSRRGGHSEYGELSHVPVTSHNLPADELMQKALQGLRCIDWEFITLELLTGTVKGKEGVDMTNLYDLSRPLRPGERVDYFVSNSWHDDPGEKMQRLTEVAEFFRSKHARWPTLWLDKTCIDQKFLSDGLLALPIYVMMCSEMLVLCGSTYPTRLWCCWELFVLFAFASEDQALERVKFVALDKAWTDTDRAFSYDVLENFSVAEARCYDPNEQAQLQRVILLVGVAEFDRRIQLLASVCRARAQQKKRSILSLQRSSRFKTTKSSS